MLTNVCVDLLYCGSFGQAHKTGVSDGRPQEFGDVIPEAMNIVINLQCLKHIHIFA